MIRRPPGATRTDTHFPCPTPARAAEMLEALSAGKFDGVDKEQAAGLGRASKGFAREFFELEIDDTKRYVRDRDGQRTRGTYLLGGEAQADARSEEHTSELPSLMRNSYAVFCLKKKTRNTLTN